MGLSAQGSLGEVGRGGQVAAAYVPPPSVCLFLFWFVGLFACLFSKEKKKVRSFTGGEAVGRIQEMTGKIVIGIYCI